MNSLELLIRIYALIFAACLNPISGQEVPEGKIEFFDPSIPIIIHGEEPDQVNMRLPDGGIPPLPGVHNLQLFRSTRDLPDQAEGDGWTYAHHQDLAAWQGRLYAAWAMTPLHEDLPPYKVMYATSGDGLVWSKPADLFPRSIAWAARFYFYRSGNGRMLAFCTGKIPMVTDVTEAIKNVLLVREISSDHELGEVYTLIGPASDMAPSFETARNQGLLAAFREAKQNNLLLEQSDYGNYLGDRKMEWHDITPKYKGFYPFGKAFCFYHRADGKIVGVCKMGFTTLSSDGGKSWSEPVLPPTLKTGAAKVWGQKTPDDRFILVYNPDDVQYRRYPLILVQGEDGREFHDMRVIHGEYPIMRYPGRYKDFGAQYVRGLTEWSNDSSIYQEAVWLIYSVHKEDIWISRIPLPVQSAAPYDPSHDFESTQPGGFVPGWNVYAPLWAPVNIKEEPGQQGNRCLVLQDGDPYDYARAKCLFAAAKEVSLNMRIKALQEDARLEIEMVDGYNRRPFRMILDRNGKMYVQDGDYSRDLGSYYKEEWIELTLHCDRGKGSFTLSVNGKIAGNMHLADAGANHLRMLDLRTGPWRGITEDPLRYNHDFKQSDSHYGPVPEGTDIPLVKPAIFLVDDVEIKTSRGLAAGD
jgi:hypothetical protein